MTERKHPAALLPWRQHRTMAFTCNFLAFWAEIEHETHASRQKRRPGHYFCRQTPENLSDLSNYSSIFFCFHKIVLNVSKDSPSFRSICMFCFHLPRLPQPFAHGVKTQLFIRPPPPPRPRFPPQLIDARMYKVVTSLSHRNFRTATNFSRACLSPSATHAAAASANGNVYVWDIARNSSGAGTASEMAAAGTSAVILETHGAAATGCDWCLNMPCTLASCDAGGGLRVWG